MSIAEALSEATGKMDQAVEKVQEDFSAIRTGRANPALLTGVTVDYYGTQTPLKALANFSVPEPRVLIVNPFDRGSINDIEKAIRDSGLGLNPSNDGVIIRCVFPELTEDRRKEYIKMAKARAEDGKIAIRNVRRTAKDELQRIEDDGEAGADEVERGTKKLEELTATHVARIDDLVANKEAELLEV